MLEQHKQELEALKAQLAAKEKELEAAREAELKALPGRVGLRTIAELVDALKPYLPTARTPKAKVAPVKQKRKRAKVTEEMRSKIIADLSAKTMSAKEIADKYEVSVPTVQLIKQKAKLTKQRGDGAEVTAPAPAI